MNEGNREDMEGPVNSDNLSSTASQSQTSNSPDPNASSPSTSHPDGSSGAGEKKHQAEGSIKKEPVCLLILGMAGSGKTSLLRRLDAHLNVRRPHYTINLDPAVDSVPYITYIDIRDTVNYKEVGKLTQYLGVGVLIS